MFKQILLVLCVCLLTFSVSAKKKDDLLTLASPPQFKQQNKKILKRLWSKGLKAGGSQKRYYPEMSQPTIVDNTIYVGTYGARFYAVNRDTGKLDWTFENDEPIASIATVSNGRVFFSDLGGHMICLDQASGNLIWKQNFDQEILGRPVAHNDTLYFLKGEKDIIALSQTSGTTKWRQRIRTYMHKMTMHGHSSLVLDGASLYLGLADGHLYRLNTNDGRVIWDKNLSIPLRTFKDIDATVLIEGDSLYVGGYFGAFYRLNKASGAVQWSTDVPTATTPVIINDVVIVSDIDGSIVGLSKKTGAQLWFNELESGVLSAPVAFNENVFVSSYDHDAFLLNPTTGYQVQKIGAGEGSINQPLVKDGRIYLLTHGAKLIALGE